MSEAGERALDRLAGLVLDDGRRWGEAAERWQLDDARAVLDPGEGDPRLNWLGRPKGGSKSTDAAGFSIAWLCEQAPPLAEAFALASDREQADRLLAKARGFISRTPGLSELEVLSGRIVHKRSGAFVQALAADVAGSEGLLSPWIVIDELPNWADSATARGMWTSAFSAVPKWPGCRLIVIGHASSPEHWSRRVLDRALVSPGWRVNEVPGPLAWIGAADLEEQRAMLTESEFRRRHLNEWVSGEDLLASRSLVEACAVLPGPLAAVPGVRYVVAVDVGLKHDRTAVAVCHAEDVGAPTRREWFAPRVEVEDEVAVDLDVWRERRDRWADAARERLSSTVVLDRMETWQGSRLRPVRLSEVEEWLAMTARIYNHAPIVFDPFQAVGMMQRLQDRGLVVSEFTFSSSSVGRLATTLHLLLRDRALRLPRDDEALLDELANVRLRESSPGVVRMDHVAGRHDDRAIVIAMAAVSLLDSPEGVVRSLTVVDRRMGGRRAR